MRVVLQAEQRFVREALASLLGAQPGVAAVTAVAALRDVAPTAERLRATVVAFELPAIGSKRCVADLARQAPGARLVGIVTKLAADRVDAAAWGLSAVISAVTDIGAVVVSLRAGERLALVERPKPTAPPAPVAGSLLTSREREVLVLVGQGQTSREIAVQLGISRKTVENHKQRLFSKLGVQSQAHAVAVAWRTGIMTAGAPVALAQ